MSTTGPADFSQPPPAPNIRPELLGGQRPDVALGRVLVTAGENFDGYEILRYQGIAWGISVRAKDMGQDCLMGCKNLTGGELQSYAELGNEARQRALTRMFDSAKRQRANAVINFRFEYNPGHGGTGAVVAYGTAVIIQPIPDYVPVGAAGALLRDISDGLAGKK